MRIYDDSEIEDVYGPVEVASTICGLSFSIRDRLQRQLTGISRRSFAPTYVMIEAADAPYDFALKTSLGFVYARLSFVRDEKWIVGKYTFYLGAHDAQNTEVFKPIFAMLFNHQEKYIFGDEVRLETPDRGYQAFDQDFAWRLSGNIQLSIYNQLETARAKSFAIESLAISSSKN